jgi:hypothetical protein
MSVVGMSSVTVIECDGGVENTSRERVVVCEKLRGTVRHGAILLEKKAYLLMGIVVK